MILITVLIYLYWYYFANAGLYSWTLSSTKLSLFSAHFCLLVHIRCSKVFVVGINCAVPILILSVPSGELILNLEKMGQIWPRGILNPKEMR